MREFVELAFAEIGRRIEWQGKGVDEKGCDAKTGDVLVAVDPRYFRPDRGRPLARRPDARRARSSAGGTRRAFKDLVKEMVEADLVAVEREYRAL